MADVSKIVGVDIATIAKINKIDIGDIGSVNGSIIPHGDEYTKLLLHMDGADDGVVFTDSSSNGFTVTPTGVVTKTAVKKFGTASGFINGSGTYLTVQDNAAWNFGTAPFTVDFWVYHTDVTTALEYSTVWNQTVDASNRFALCAYAANAFWAGSFIYLVIGGTAIYRGWTWTPTINTWYHVAFARTGANLYFYVDGVLKTMDGPSAEAFDATTDIIDLGADPTIGKLDAEYFTGYFDEIRVSPGVDRYGGSGFTPPTGAYG